MNYTLAETILKLEDVSLRFGDFLCLRDINIEVKDIVSTVTTLGQVTTLLGKSGVGKTQLMKIIAGLQKPTTGTVLVGKEQKAVEPGVVGMVLQTYPLFKHRTLESNLNLVSNDKEKIEYYMQEFDIYQHRKKYPKALSGGQKQRTAIVQQLLTSEHFVLLDEPFSGLDPVATEKLCRVINKIANLDEQNTVIISSHILEPSMAISDSVWIVGHEYVMKEEVRTKVEGATILYQEDLASQGLAWQPDIRKERKFIDLVENIRNTFQTL